MLLKINTDGLVLRGWYTCLTLAVYGTAERPHSHERDSPPPPPPPLPQQQQLGSKRIIKTGQHKRYIHKYIMTLCKMMNTSLNLLQSGKMKNSLMAAHQDHNLEGHGPHQDHHLQTTMRRRHYLHLVNVCPRGNTARVITTF